MAASLFAVLGAGPASASTIGTVGVAGALFGTGSINGAALTLQPGNSNPFGTLNTISIQETIVTFNPSKGFALGLDVLNSAGTTDYLVSKTILNSSGFTWSDFTIAVGCDPVGGTPPGTVPCSGGSPLLINFGIAPISSAGGVMTNSGPTFFTFSGLNVANTQSVTFLFYLDVASGAAGTKIMYQYPPGAGSVTTPEPTTFALTGVGLIGLAFLKRRTKLG